MSSVLHNPAYLPLPQSSSWPQERGTVESFLERCRQEQASWSAVSLRRRLQCLRAFRYLLVSERVRLCGAVARDVGKSAAETLSGDILPLADACLFLEKQAPRLLRPRRIPLRQRPLWLWGQSDAVFRRPRGIVGLIGTWNYPLFINGVPLVQALTAGNGVLWKPSELAPASAAVLVELLLEAGYPEGLIGLLPATREAGAQLAEAAIDHVVFVGSSQTGRLLAANLGRRLTSSTMELSGCDAMFLLDDADATFAAQAAWFGATINRGQACIGVRRVFVPRSLYEAFSAALVPLVTQAQPVILSLPAQVEQVEQLVHQAEAAGAKRIVRGARENRLPSSCAATAVLDARPEMALCREASFAPLLAVISYDTLDEALRMDACCSYGLGASIFTENPHRAVRLAEKLRTGMVTINDVVVPTAHPATPFGGRGESGWGVTQGEEGLLEMTVPQVVSMRRGKFRPHFDLACFSSQGRSGAADEAAELASALLHYKHAAGCGERLRGLVRLLAGVWKLRR